jgi:prefoldin subunit 5
MAMQIASSRTRIRELETENARLHARVAALEARIEELLALVAKQQTRIEILERASGSGPGGTPLSPPAACERSCQMTPLRS